MASSNLRKPAKAKRLNVVILRFAKVGLYKVSLAISDRIFTVIGFLF